MSLPDITFQRIRPHHGSQHKGFEELCSQLAFLESAPPGSTFDRTGQGADAGVECYRIRPDGSEIGWQAKYLFGWSDSLTCQLDKSIRTALDKHPRLNEYVVCLPFDLSDARGGRHKSARQKWSEWCKRWERTARAEGRKLSFDLWGESQLVARLTASDAPHQGRLLYWFGVDAFTPEWFSEQFAKTKTALGERYTPETNVSLPIRREFLAFARDPDLQKEVDEWFIRLSDEGQSAVNAIKRAAASAAESHSEPLKAAVDKLAHALGDSPIASDQVYPLNNWCSCAVQCRDVAWVAMRWVCDLPAAKSTSVGSEPSRSAQIGLQKLIGVLRDIEEEVTSRRWRLANAKAVLLVGPAGIGKSHLLADIIEHQVHEGRPAVLVLGSSFNDDEPWHQILKHLDRPPNEQVKHFLGCLDAAAEAAGTRALVCIDALNERNGIDIWPHHLASFLKTVQPFSRVSVIVSCRSTYVPNVIPANLNENQLPRVEHQGFAADGGAGAKTYLEKRGIVRPGAPNLLPEFANPLFLKTCCDRLDDEGKKELPHGLRGITSIFGFYTDAITRALNDRMKFDRHFEVVPRAIAEFSRRLASKGEWYIDKSEAIHLFESVRASNGNREESLLTQLASEGILSIEPVRQDDGSLIEMVRFTFERFSDYAIARQLLADHLDRRHVVASFAAGKPLHDVVFGPENYRCAGVIEALAVQLPEETGVEILDLGGEISWPVEEAFAASLVLREQTHFTNRTFNLARKQLSQDDLTKILIAIGTEPSNKFNASYVHERLKNMGMPKRDAFWSVFLAKRGYSGEVETLISWAAHSGLDPVQDDRAYLAGLMLTWFLTTSHRTVRDKATKALACILSRHLLIAARLVREFASVNDPYVLERLLAACYGAVLQGNSDGLAELSSTVFELVFAREAPPIDALLRDHAQGVIEYAKWRGVLPPAIAITSARPSYKSPWPIDFVPDDLIETYTATHNNHTSPDAIVRSTVQDGDFARYQLNYKVSNWSPALLGTWPLPSPEDVYETWLKEFASWASNDRQAAFNELVTAANEAKGVGDYQKTPKSERRGVAKARFKALLTSDQWEDFRVRAEDVALDPSRAGWRNLRSAIFNLAWARRWVCKGAHELGWTPSLFGVFEDLYRGYDRHQHEVERIGKKYQWIALRELLARLADNLVYMGKVWEDPSEPQAYQGAREIGLRDIDPSLLTSETHYHAWADQTKTWWVPFRPVLRPVSPPERRAWLLSDSDVVNDVRLIDITQPKSKRRWLALWGFAHWSGWGLHDGHKHLERDTWFRLVSLVVRKKDEAALIRALKNKIFTEPHSLPDIDLHGDFYLGEYPWHPALEGVDQWTSPENDWRSIPVPVRPTVATYTCERGNYDYSIDRTVSLKIPAPWLAQALGLRMSDGRSAVYVDASECDVFHDPSVLETGPSAALVDRDAFLKMLERENLSAVWIIAGDKGAYSGGAARMGFGGRQRHTAIYWLGANGLTNDFRKEVDEPTDGQLEEFLRR